MGVLAHYDATEEYGHNARQVDALRQGVRNVDEAEHEGKLQRRVETQIHVLEYQGTDQSHDAADPCVF